MDTLKNIATLFLFLANAFPASAQENKTLANIVWTFGDSKSITVKKNPASECGVYQILFLEDGSFFAVNRCRKEETLTYGTYYLKKEGLTLAFSASAVLKYFDAGAKGERYRNPDAKPFSVTLKAEPGKNRLYFKGDGKELVPSGENYAKLLAGISADNRVARLNGMVQSDQNIFANTDFSVKYDTIIIRKGLEKLNAEIMRSYFDDDNNPNTPTEHYNKGKVVYSPDGQFKLFVFTGEGCGAHCMSMYADIIQFRSGDVSNYLELNDVTAIEKYSEGTYLILDTAWYGGTTGSNELSVNLLSIRDGHVSALPLTDDTFSDPVMEKHFTHLFRFWISNPWWGNDFEKLQYDPVLRKISYSYVDPGIDTEWAEKVLPDDKKELRSGEGLLISGGFVLKDGKISDFKEEYKIVDVK